MRVERDGSSKPELLTYSFVITPTEPDDATAVRMALSRDEGNILNNGLPPIREGVPLSPLVSAIAIIGAWKGNQEPLGPTVTDEQIRDAFTSVRNQALASISDPA